MSFSLSLDEITGYNEFLAKSWHEWLQRNPGALDVPCDIMNTGTVRGLVKHIFAAELRYAEQLNGRQPPEYGELADSTLEDLYGIRQRGEKSLREFLNATNDAALDEVIEVKTRSSGMHSVSRRTILIHAMTHGTRHWAQLATMTRQAGYPSIRGQDYLFYKLSK